MLTDPLSLDPLVEVVVGEVEKEDQRRDWLLRSPLLRRWSTAMPDETQVLRGEGGMARHTTTQSRHTLSWDLVGFGYFGRKRKERILFYTPR